jgi:hypothetical protein
MRAVLAGFSYFLLCFAAGMVMGPIREFVLAPHLGRMGALFAEAPVMLTVSVLAALFVLTRREPPFSRLEATVMGLSGLAFLLANEFAFALFLRGETPIGYVVSLMTPFGALSFMLFLAFGAAPILITAWRRNRDAARR